MAPAIGNGPSIDMSLESPELLRAAINHYKNQKAIWMKLYYTTKAITIILAAAIPVMTTVNVWPWTIAIVGSCIVALEGISQLWHFHDRYVSGRVLLKALEQEQILYTAKVGDYETLDGEGAQKKLATRISEIMRRYESEVMGVLRDEPGTKVPTDPTSASATTADVPASPRADRRD